MAFNKALLPRNRYLLMSLCLDAFVSFQFSSICCHEHMNYLVVAAISVSPARTSNTALTIVIRIHVDRHELSKQVKLLSATFLIKH